VIPEALRWWSATPEGAAWLERLPRLVDECAALWDLEVGEPLGGHAAYVVSAALGDGTPVVLKLNFPEHESEHEAAALEHYGPAAAPRVLAHDPARRTLLLERIEPGSALPDDEVEAVVPDILATIWRPPARDHPFRALHDEAERWAHAIPDAWERGGRPFARALVDEAVAALRALGPTQPDQVVVHQDLHAGNVLRGARAPWLVIDPKPLAGERAFDLVALARNRPDPAFLRRLALATGVDPERARGWALAHALAWGCQGGRWLPGQVAAAAALSGTRARGR
jgi:streptomycin 6-kinase